MREISEHLYFPATDQLENDFNRKVRIPDWINSGTTNNQITIFLNQEKNFLVLDIFESSDRRKFWYEERFSIFKKMSHNLGFVGFGEKRLLRCLILGYASLQTLPRVNRKDRQLSVTKTI